MRKVVASAVAAGLLAVTMLVTAGDGAGPVQASHGNLNVHVHDDYYHPAGKFIVGSGTDHALAKAACETANPDAECNAVIHVGDTITWVSPSPLAVNPHTVTECTSPSFAVCGPAVSAANPIGDSGVRNPPSPGPSGWPYGPIQFNTPGVYYYRCEVHPNVMRGRVVVQETGVGGIVREAGGEPAARSESAEGPGSGKVLSLAAALGLGFVVAAGGAWYARRRLLG